MEYKYKFQGQERQDELGLNVTAMDFRMYDNALGRFHNIDAMTEVMPSLSPYRFAFNNPVIWKDPSGLSETSDVVEEHWDLDEVVVTAKARKSYHNTRPADFGTYHLAKGLNTERFKGTLQQYNKTFGTDFKNYDDWYYRALYVPFRNEMINDMHSAQAKAGQAIMLLVGSVFAAPILAASPAVASITSVASNPIVQNITLNAGSQYLANGGNAGDINMIEAGLSGVPGTNLMPTIAGETFSFTTNDGFQAPTFDKKWAVQVGGGILSNRFGKATDTYLKGEGAGGAAVGGFYKFIVETGSNAAPNAIKE